jgi:hypothetical protein
MIETLNHIQTEAVKQFAGNQKEIHVRGGPGAGKTACAALLAALHLQKDEPVPGGDSLVIVHTPSLAQFNTVFVPQLELAFRYLWRDQFTMEAFLEMKRRVKNISPGAKPESIMGYHNRVLFIVENGDLSSLAPAIAQTIRGYEPDLRIVTTKAKEGTATVVAYERAKHAGGPKPPKTEG